MIQTVFLWDWYDCSLFGGDIRFWKPGWLTDGLGRVLMRLV